MKKITLTLVIIVISISVSAQWTDNGNNFTSGQLAIGSSATWAPITINSVSGANANVGVALAFEGSSEPEIGYRFKANGNNYYQVLYDGSSINWKFYIGNGVYSSRMSLSNSGFLGLNNSSPWAPITINSVSGTNSNVGVALAFEGASEPEIGYRFKANGNNYYQVLYDGSSVNWKHYVGNGVYTTRMSLSNSGSLGIGTTSTGSHKLAVQGSIGAREIKVEADGWSDFVFEKDYKLRTLEDVEEHIVEKGHLPEIPSEAEVIESGINLGEMDAKLLQKIEELTLYMIEMNKQLNSQSERVAQLEQENSELKEKVNRLETK